ncbi:precorrin-2 C(20)-methyltransferase [Lachnospiraceae bacterium 62-35]
MAGKLYGIGVGPGDPELLTLKAVRLIKECDVIMVPGKDYRDSVAYQIALKAVPELAQKPVKAVYMPMTRDRELLERGYQEAAETAEGFLSMEKTVGFLTLGDVSIYSTYLYIHRLVASHGYATKMISGVPSFCAAAARLNTGLAEGAEELHVIPAAYQVEEGLSYLLKDEKQGDQSTPGTVIFMKAGKKIGLVKEKIQSAGLSAAMVERCGMEGEKVYDSVEEMNGEAGYYSLVIVRTENRDNTAPKNISSETEE